MPSRARRSLCLPILSAAMLAAGTGLVGCESDSAQRERLVRNNLTPELDTLHERPSDIDNAITITFDENGRMFNEDLGRFFLLNRPSRLTPEPMPRP